MAAVSEALRERGRAEGVIHVQAWLVFNFAKPYGRRFWCAPSAFKIHCHGCCRPVGRHQHTCSIKKYTANQTKTVITNVIHNDYNNNIIVRQYYYYYYYCTTCNIQHDNDNVNTNTNTNKTGAKYPKTLFQPPDGGFNVLCSWDSKRGGPASSAGKASRGEAGLLQQQLQHPQVPLLDAAEQRRAVVALVDVHVGVGHGGAHPNGSPDRGVAQGPQGVESSSAGILGLAGKRRLTDPHSPPMGFPSLERGPTRGRT